MKREILYVIVLVLYNAIASGQSSTMYPGQINPSAIPKLNQHYQDEFTFDVPRDSLRWQNQKPGIHVSFASTDEKYFRSEVPEIKSGETLLWEMSGWKGERLNTSILIWSQDTLNQIRIIVNDLVDTKGSRISKACIHVDKVQYVVSDYPYGAKDITCGESPYTHLQLLPDRFTALHESDRFDLPGRTTRPVWLSIDIPSSTKPGIYHGTIAVKTDKYNVLLHVKVKVQTQTLPKPHKWKFRLDLWQNPWVVAQYYHLQPWSTEHLDLLKTHLHLYADAGGKFITTYAVHSPWADNSYMLEGGMIGWIKMKNNSWTFDYTIFDQYVQLAMDAGIDKAITVYTPLPWGNRFRYLDEQTGNYVVVSWAPETVDFKNVWNIFLEDLKIHLLKKGWFGKTYIGINENELRQTLAAIDVIHRNDKRWNITYAGDWHPELDSLVNDYSSIYGNEPSIDNVRSRTSRGLTSTYYICCTPPKPNTFIASPAVEGTFLGWYAAAYNYDGFLRWAYDAWPQDPMRDARHTLWAAGDCFMVYPGGRSSIRFEKMREGIVDFEKIRILKELAAKSKNKEIKNQILQLENHLKVIATKNDSDESCYSNAVINGKKILEKLSDEIMVK